jgi:hypothetical protein
MLLMIDAIRYRLLHEWRSILWNNSRSRWKAALLFVTPALALATVGSYHAMLIRAAAPDLQAGLARREGVIGAAFLASGALVFLVSCAEILQQVWFARDQELLAVAPVSRHAHIVYSLFFAAWRGAPWAAVFLSLPVLAASALPAAGFWATACAVGLGALFWAWLTCAALCAGVLVPAVFNRTRLERHTLFVLVYLLQIGAMGFIIRGWLTPAAWLEFAGEYEFHGLLAMLPHHQMASLIVRCSLQSVAVGALRAILLAGTLLLSALACYLVTLRFWPQATLPASSRGSGARTTRARRCRQAFLAGRSWVICWKDRRDLLRNPLHRSWLLANYLLLLLGLWAQARKESSSRLLMLILPVICVVPLTVSARTVSQECQFLELYKLIFPAAYSILDAKLRAQGVVNTILSFAVALPFFLLLKPGFETFTVLYYVCICLLYAPVLTALALALGTYFPDLSATPGMLGLRWQGALLYCLSAAVLYSFLLNRLYLGAALYSLFLVPLTAALYCGARRRLDSLMERRMR